MLSLLVVEWQKQVKKKVIGNSRECGLVTMEVSHSEAALGFRIGSNLHLCQWEFVIQPPGGQFFPKTITKKTKQSLLGMF